MSHKPAKEELAYWDSLLDEYENKLGLPKYRIDCVPEQELEEYLTMDRSVIEKLTPEDCGQIAYRLGQFAFHIQRSLNRELARHDWSEEQIKETIADEINNYNGYGYLEKSGQAIKHNEKAQALQNIKKFAKQRANRLSYLASSVKNLSDIIINVYRSKVKHVSQ